MRSVLVVLLMCAAVPAGAQRALTLGEALQLARHNNRDLAAARTRLDQAAVGVEQAWAMLLPNVATQGKYTHNYKDVSLDLGSFVSPIFGLADVVKGTSHNPQQNGAINAYEQGVAQGLASQGPIVIQKGEQLDFALNATVPLVIPSAYPGLSAARRSVDAASANYGATEAQLLFGAAQAFYAAAGGDEAVTARHHAVEVAQKTRDDANSRFNAGVVNRVELTRAQLALDRALQAEREARDGAAQAYRALATVLLLREPFHVAPAEHTPPPSASAEQLTTDALKLRPEIVALQRTLDSTDAQLSSAKWRWAPTLSAFGTVRAFNYKGFSGDYYAWAVGAELDWVLYDGGARDAARHLADAQARESQLHLDQLRDTIADDVVNAQTAMATKQSAFETAERAVELSEETLKLVRAQHDAGTATQLDLLQAQDTLVTAELSRAQARFDLALADLSLQRTAGLFPKNLGDARP